MIDLATVVYVVLYLLIVGAVLGLLIFLVNYVAAQFPSEPMALFARIARVVIVILAVLLLIGLLVSFINGAPLFRWGPR